EEGEGVGGRAGEAGDDRAVAEPAQLLGIGFDDGLAHRHLAVAGDHHAAALAQAEDGRAVPDLSVLVLHGGLARRDRVKMWVGAGAGQGNRLPALSRRASLDIFPRYAGEERTHPANQWVALNISRQSTGNE